MAVIRVLIADDSAEDRAVLTRYLTRDPDQTYDIHEAATGEEALQLNAAVQPDCLLIDYRLPDLDGLELLTLLLDQAPSDAKPAALVLTGQGDERVAVGAIKAGAADYISKGDLSPELLSERVRQALRHASLQRALNRSRDSFRHLVESAAESIAVLRNDRVIYANATFLKWLGYSRLDDLADTPALEALVHPDDRDAVRARVARLEVEPVGFRLPHRITKFLRSDGVTLLGDSVTVSTEFEGEQAWVSMVRDVTERHQLEQRLRQSERLASIGTLAAGVAHEINNPLAGVMANLEYVQETFAETPDRTPEVEEIREVLAETYHAAERISKIVRGMKSFSRVEVDEPEPLALSEVLDAAVSMARTEVRHRAHLVREFQPAPRVFADEGRLAQVFINLIVNAAQCYEDGRAAQNAVRLVTRTDADGNAVAEVIDHGPGIDATTRARIFDPFFTTKDPGSGTGMGLSIAHNLIVAAGGRLECESEVGVGTKFRVVLPPHEAGSPRSGVEEPSSACTAYDTRPTVLVIDDEPVVGAAVRRSLQRDHDVETVLDAREALERLSGGEEPDVIFCDVMMPRMSGMEFYRVLRERAPQYADRVIFMTGGAFSKEAREFLETTDRPVLEKPFDFGEVRRVIEELLVSYFGS